MTSPKISPLTVRTLAALALVCLCLCLLAGCIVVPIGGLGQREMQEVTVIEAERLLTTSRFLLLDISGTISFNKSQEFLSEGTSLVEDVNAALERAREDRDIKALIVRIDSPGGGVTASDIIHREIVRYHEDTGVPVVAMLMGTAASGGYYVASAAERIVAHPTTVTGSIGVIVVGFNLEGLGELIGVEVDVYTSGRHKDLLSPFRTMTEEDRAIIQSVVDEMFGKFIDAVAEGRSEAGLSRDMIETLADGRIYTADQALAAGLIDEIAYLPDFVDTLREELGLRDVEVITYRRDGTSDYNIYSHAPQPPRAFQAPQIDVNLIDADVLTRGLAPGFHYLWLPGL